MRAQMNAGCCIAFIAAMIVLPAAWLILVLTDAHPDFVWNQFRHGLGSQQVQELAIWTQWRLKLRKEPSAEYTARSFDELMQLITETITPESWEEAGKLSGPIHIP